MKLPWFGKRQKGVSSNQRPQLFNSYRRGDARIRCGRLYDCLTIVLDGSAAFCDLDVLRRGPDCGYYSHATPTQASRGSAFPSGRELYDLWDRPTILVARPSTG